MLSGGKIESLSFFVELIRKFEPFWLLLCLICMMKMLLLKDSSFSLKDIKLFHETSTSAAAAEKKNQNPLNEFLGCDGVCNNASEVTRGYLRSGRLHGYVYNEIVLGVMGCPNWPGDSSDGTTGTLMLSHTGCGTWTKSLLQVSSADWTRRFVDACGLVNKARFVIQESQPWESLPLSSRFDAKIGSGDLHGNEIRLLPTCHGSLCKYLMVASGRASVFFLRARTERKSIKSWDHAVGIICVHEAGGKVTDWEGDDINLEEDQSERRIIFPAGGILVSNGSLHDQLLEMISSASPAL